jgi:hypothetical protein
MNYLITYLPGNYNIDIDIADVFNGYWRTDNFKLKVQTNVFTISNRFINDRGR